MYNVKVKKYKHGEIQTRFYSDLVITGSHDDGRYHSEKFIPLSSLEEIEPFTGERVRLYQDLNNLEAEMEEIKRVKKERSLSVSCNRAKQKIYDLSRSNDWQYFVTLTLSPDKVDRYNYDECVKKVRKWLDNCKQRCSRSFRYVVVPERHKDGAYHFHGLFSDCEGLKMTPSGRFDDKGRIIYNIGKYRLGWTTATAVEDNTAVTKYITKYVTKDLLAHAKGRQHYWYSTNCELPQEEMLLLDVRDFNSYEHTLIEDAQYFKQVNFNIGLQELFVRYYENIDKETIEE